MSTRQGATISLIDLVSPFGQIPFILRNLLNHDDVCLHASQLTLPLEILAITWHYSILFGYHDALYQIVNNLENIIRVSTSKRLGDNIHSQDILAIRAAYGLKHVVTNNDGKAVRIYLESIHCCKLIAHFLETNQNNDDLFILASPIFNISVEIGPYLYVREVLDTFPGYLNGSVLKSQNPLLNSLRRRNDHLFEILITYYQFFVLEKAAKRREILQEACYDVTENCRVLQLLISKTPERSLSNLGLLNYCATFNCAKSMAFLLAPNNNLVHDFTNFFKLVEIAVERNNCEDVVVLLLNSCPSAAATLRNFNYLFPLLEICARKENIDVARVLLNSCELGKMTLENPFMIVNLLKICVVHNSLEFAVLLFHLGFSSHLNYPDASGRSPLYYTAENLGNSSILKLFLDHGVDPCVRDDRGNTTIHLLVLNGPFRESMAVTDYIRKFVQREPQAVNVTNHAGLTPLASAIYLLLPSVVDSLLENGADHAMLTSVNFPPAVILKSFVANQFYVYQIFTSLLACGMNPNSLAIETSTQKSVPILLIACQCGRLDVVKALLAFGANWFILDSNNASALQAAGCNIDIARLIVHGIDSSEGEYSRYLAAEWLQVSQTVKPSPYTEFTVAEFVNLRDCEGNSTLHTSSGEMLSFLIGVGADVNLQNNAGETALHCAIRGGEESDIFRILDRRPDLSLKNHDGMTGLDLVQKWDLKLDIALIKALQGEYVIDWNSKMRKFILKENLFIK
ncbi:Ankyrin repeat domain-containing protein 61 [Nowakowskiella sp. JEL0407]|nr:Ankyrin repeat domain-containing protein 61 [Nowakowskiella sp. JEL0407]